MAKRSSNLPSEAVWNFILCEEGKDFSEISSGSVDETVFLGNVADTSGSVRTATGGACYLQSRSLSACDYSGSESDSSMGDADCYNNAERVVKGTKGTDFHQSMMLV
jgi:hypothetical protein